MTPEQLSSTDKERLHERLQELGGLACVMSFRPELTFEAGPPDSPWCFRFDTAVLSAPINDLLDRSMDFCRGLTLHEAAHATVTRIFDLIRRDFFEDRSLHALFNSIEDCRIETWIKDRSPGAAPWIRLYNDRLFAPILNGPPIQSLATQFNMSILSKWWFGEEPKTLAPEVKKALEETWPAIEEAIAMQPPRIEMESEIINRAYANSRTLQFSYMRSDIINPPSDFEKLVRIRQLQMVHVVLHKILPTYKTLCEQDKKNQQGEGDLERFLQSMRGHHVQQAHGQQQAQQGQQQGQASQSQQVQQAQQAQNRQFQAGSGNAQQEIEKALEINPRDTYLREWKKLAPEIDILSEELLQVFQKRNRMRWLNGYPSGARLDVRQAMAFEADPRRYRVLWQRKSNPTRIDPSFTLLIDRSGSMEGERMEGTFQGLVLLSEVCARLGIPLEVMSFANNYKMEHSWDTPLTEEARLKLGRLGGQPHGGTYLGAALKEIFNRMKDVRFRNRFLIVLSDGIPHDEAQAHVWVRALEQEGVSCIGLGIGEDTKGLNRFFSEGMYEVTPREVAHGLAHWIRTKLIQ